MSIATEEKPLVRIVEIGCRDFLAVGDKNIPVDEIKEIDLNAGGNCRIAHPGGGYLITDTAEIKALREFVYSRV